MKTCCIDKFTPVSFYKLFVLRGLWLKLAKLLTKQNFRTMNKSQIRFCRTLAATWKVLHDPVLTNIYVRKWKRQRDIHLTIYGFVFREMYKAA